ncbi:MAG: GNAT family N-acetyltransferase [Chloroflexi bacterium]|jgi:ribosomal protein S18 acetylase RimI-like enzyme|nr:GNAT family N-acetyltransferase [Chloroflexota bacterium]
MERMKVVRLVPMDDGDWRDYLEFAVGNYAEEKVRAGNWPADQALQLSRQAFQSLLPSGRATRDQHFYTILDDEGNKAGYVWLGVLREGDEPSAYLYDFLVFEQYRRRGIGTAALQAAEAKAREMGLKKMGLHVFGHNLAARGLYEKLGYVPVNINMEKSLD